MSDLSQGEREGWPGKPGEHRWIAHGLDPYHAVNLREALKLVQDTGDWHGSLRAACNLVLRECPEMWPNVRAEDQQEPRLSQNEREEAMALLIAWRDGFLYSHRRARAEALLDRLAKRGPMGTDLAASRSPEAIERAAEAIYEANRHRLGLPWERLIGVTKEDCRMLARAALDAISKKEG